MTIPFTKAHGAGNDFLLTWADQAPVEGLPAIARAICDRHTGIGADGWMLVTPQSIRLFNADGSEPEMSGNGTRCAAALLIDAGLAREEVRLMTGAGEKSLRLIDRQGRNFRFEMNMGLPKYDPDQIRFQLGVQEVTIVDVGNPQCALLVHEFDPNWEAIGARIEADPFFPKRTNVSFVRVVDEHTIEVRFFERGVGPTLSSGTGSTGAAVAAILRGVAKSPVEIQTLAGNMELRWDDSVYLTGPAEIVGAGEFYCEMATMVSGK
jgi:diaminopimelate epimerase